MQCRTAILAAVLVLASAGAGQAQAQGAPVESRLTLALRVEMMNPAQTGRSVNVRRVSFSTKDVLDLMADATNRKDVRSLVVRRMVDATDLSPNPKLFDKQVMFVDRNGAAIASGAGMMVSLKALDLTPLSPLLSSNSKRVRDTRNRGIASVDQRSVEAGELRVMDGSNMASFGLVGLSDASARRSSSRKQNLGLLFSRRTLEVDGGANLMLTASSSRSRSSSGVGTGLVTGSIRTSAEKPVRN